MEEEWEEMEEIGEVQSANQADQLEALGFKMKSKIAICHVESEIIAENETTGMRKEIQKEETYNKYGYAARKIEIGAIGEHGAFIRIPFSGIPDGGR